MSPSPVMRGVSMGTGSLILRLPGPAVPATPKAASPMAEPGGTGKPSETADDLPSVEQIRRDAYAAGAKAGRKRGFEEGVKTGQEQGRAATLAEHQSHVARFESLLEHMAQTIPRQLKDGEDDIVALAFTVVCRLLGETAHTRAGIAALLRQAVAGLRAGPLLVVRMHPADLALVRTEPALAALMARLEGPGGVQWRADEDAVLGGCMLESVHGELDARLHTQMVRLRDHLLAVRATHRDGNP